MTSTSEAPASFRSSAVRPGPIALVIEGIHDSIARRRLIRYLVQADLKKKGADTLLGNIWWILDPLLQMAVYVILVTLIFQRKQPDYPLFVFSAILPWKWFRTAVDDGTTSVVSSDRLIKQIQFPKLVLPIASAMSGIANFAFGLIPLTVLMVLFYPDRISIWLLTIPIIAFVQLLFTLPVVIAVSSSNVFYRDIGTRPPRPAHLVLSLACPVRRGGPPPADHRAAHRRHAHAAEPVHDAAHVVSRGDLRRAEPRLGGAGRGGLASLVPLVFATWYFKVGAGLREGPLMSIERSTKASRRTGGYRRPRPGVSYSRGSRARQRCGPASRTCPPAQRGRPSGPCVDVTFRVVHGDRWPSSAPTAARHALQVLAGIILPSTGVVEVAGHISACSPLALASMASGGAGQHPWLARSSACRQRRSNDDYRHRRLRRPGSLHRCPIKTHSSACGRASALHRDLRRADILLLDEVLATGDADFRAKSKARVLELVREARAIVLVTHDMEWVTEYCNRAILLEKGRIVAEGVPSDVVKVHQEHSERRKAEKEAAGVLTLQEPPRGRRRRG
jgi:hypothetical protein